jgi:hypothetical protein
MGVRFPKFGGLATAWTALSRRLLFRDGILCIPVAALLASCVRVRGVSCGHDFDFHMVSWLEVERSWSQGVLYPHWAQIPNWTAGEPRFVFYPPVTWILGALLGYTMPWSWVPAAFTFFCLLAVGLTTRTLARQFLPASNATLAGAIATTTPYALFTAYERTAFAELAAASLIPILLLFAWRRPHSVQPDHASAATGKTTSTTWLALTLAAIWLTNAPAGVMSSYLLAIAALTAAILERKWWPVIRAAIAAPLGLGLAAFYLVPAASERKWIAIQQAVDVGMRIQDSWLFARHSSPDLELHDQILRLASSICVFTVALGSLAFLLLFLRGKLPGITRRYWLSLAILIPLLFVLQFSFSAPVWNLLPELQFLQFPWRWLAILGIPFSIFLAAATPMATHRARVVSVIVWTIALIAFAGAGSLLFFQYCVDEDVVRNQSSIVIAGVGVEGTDEYASAASDNSLIASGLPDACLTSDPSQTLGESNAGMAPVWYAEQGTCDDTFTAQLWQNEHKTFQIDSDHDGFLILRLDRYPAWQITVNGIVVPSQGNREDGLVEIPVHEGPSRIEIQWHETIDEKWGKAISGMALLLLFALWLVERKRILATSKTARNL